MYIYIYSVCTYQYYACICIYIHNYIYKYTHYSCMHQFREWMGRYMKYATGRKRVMHSGMKQTCLPHSKNT